MEGKLRGHTSSLFPVAFLPDGINVVSGSKDLILWDCRTRAEVSRASKAHGSGVWKIAVVPDGSFIVSCC